MKPQRLLAALGLSAAACSAATQGSSVADSATPRTAEVRPTEPSPAPGDRTADASPTWTGPAPSARGAVNRFLTSAKRRDLRGMARVFGTRAGPLLAEAGAAPEVEVRMEAVASILDFDEHAIVGEEAVAGESGSAVRVLVDLRTRGRTVRGVPLVTVASVGGGWLVREVDLAMVMNGSAGSKR